MPVGWDSALSTFHSLLACCFPRLAPNDFVAVLDPFSLVRIRLAQRADLGRGLPDFLLVDAGDHDVPALAVHGDVDPLRDGEADRMRVSELEDDFLPLDLG